MNTNNKKNPEFLELDTNRNIGVVTIKQLEKVEQAIKTLGGELLLLAILIVISWLQ